MSDTSEDCCTLIPLMSGQIIHMDDCPAQPIPYALTEQAHLDGERLNAAAKWLANHSAELRELAELAEEARLAE